MSCFRPEIVPDFCDCLYLASQLLKWCGYSIFHQTLPIFTILWLSEWYTVHALNHVISSAPGARWICSKNFKSPFTTTHKPLAKHWQYQTKWAEGVLQLDESIHPTSELWDIAELLKYKICYHSPIPTHQLDLAQEKDQRVYVYLSRKKMQKVQQDGYVTFGSEVVLAATIQPYLSELSVQV